MKLKFNRIALAMTIALAVAPLMHEAAAQIDIGPPTCVDSGNCDADNPLELAAMAYTNVIGPWIFPLFWGLVLFLIQLSSHNSMLTSMVGVMIATLFIGTDAYTNSTSATFFYYGYVLVSIAIGCTLFFILKNKVHTG